MREILFRGKAIKCCTSSFNKVGEWIYGSLSMGSVDRTYIYQCFNSRHINWSEVDPETVGQYTGLKDKNGTKIFEGDILDYWNDDEGGNAVVQYCSDSDYPAFDLNPSIDVDCNGLQYVILEHKAEIIGNIHDNKDLLEGK